MHQDFSSQNLQGRSFRGQNLVGANFSNADIRGANFSNAILKDANFSGVLGGLPKKWLITLIAVSHSLTILSALSSISIASALRAWMGNSVFESHLILITVCMTIFFASIVIAVKQYFFKNIAFITGIIIITCGIILAISHTILALFKINIVFWGIVIGICLSISSISIIITSFSIVLIKILSKKYYPVVIVSALIAGFFGTILRIVFRGGSAVPITDLIVNPVWNWAWIDIFWGSISSWTVTIIGSYIGLSSFKGHDELTLMRKIAISFSTIGSTNFYKADLENTNFEKAILKNTDFRCANLKGVWWDKVKQLHITRVGNSYLQYPLVRQLLISRWGQNKNFERLNLRGINLKGACLTDTSFIGADLSEANLQDTDLSRAKLIQTQLDGTDFTGATLTGAYIEDWGITNETNFRGVRCKYVYMRLPTKENPDPWRKPDNREEVFADGEFGDFIKPHLPHPNCHNR